MTTASTTMAMTTMMATAKAQWLAARQDMMTTTMATGDDVNGVGSDGDNDDDNDGNDDDDGNGDGAIGSGAKGYNDNDDGDGQ